MADYGLDMHGNLILDEYRQMRPALQKMKEVALSIIRKDIADKNLMVTATEARVKEEGSLAGKLALKGHKYATARDITDLLGVRVITFYSDDVEKIAAMAENLFDIDRENSVDKRKMHQLDSFGYSSLHYICRIPERLYKDPEFPLINEIRFELQIRTSLQHVWATLYHDSGYKSGVEVPREYLRQMNRLAGMLELADEQFCAIRSGINDYRRRVQSLVADGRLEEVALDGDTFKSYLALRPFDALNRRIASVNQAEIQEAPLQCYLPILKDLGMNTLGDVDRMVHECHDDAFRLATYQLGVTDIDIITSAVALQNLCIVKILAQGGGKPGLQAMFDTLNGNSESNASLAEMIYQQAETLKLT
jgi:ppGpp synthetase/RelA/SpoT-type nucleotidyltranferase